MSTLLPGQILGFPLIRGGPRRRVPDALQEGKVALASVAASVPDDRQGFLPTHKKLLPRTNRSLSPSHPPTSLRHHGLDSIFVVSL